MKIGICFRSLKSLLLMDKIMIKLFTRLKKILSRVMIAYAFSILIDEAIRDVQYAQVEPGNLDLLSIFDTNKRSKWHSFSGLFLLLRRRSP
jgi:hypothetical protein